MFAVNNATVRGNTELSYLKMVQCVCCEQCYFRGNTELSYLKMVQYVRCEQCYCHGNTELWYLRDGAVCLL